MSILILFFLSFSFALSTQSNKGPVKIRAILELLSITLFIEFIFEFNLLIIGSFFLPNLMYVV